MIFFEKFFFKDKEEALSKEGNNDKNIADDNHALHQTTNTVSSELDVLSEKYRFENPIITIPIKTVMDPMIFCFFILAFRNVIEKKKVVIIDPPRSI